MGVPLRLPNEILIDDGVDDSLYHGNIVPKVARHDDREVSKIPKNSLIDSPIGDSLRRTGKKFLSVDILLLYKDRS